ncbi:hypothetical protein SERLA73DRAFT_140303 [Serpula lacrymans var. lacrymans S7.3]|uniref:Major facilitator superfamily (MFS) profile domain-containing protein n=1 Tax=Serpula lacrymans var. lacrymans (strain S7.3) TaxID=936435 RepID=F8Q525_SERL3|nr:hypothetical protein SERLA73DRAFT_140303 [Serpula lacrymans var. lacrymans S7.3]
MPGGPAATGAGIGANAPKNAFAGILMTAFAAFGGVLYGYDTGTINGIKSMCNWLETFGHEVPVSTLYPCGYTITSSQESLVVSILSAGTFFGALLGAPAADILGRKWGIIFSGLVFCIGVAMQTASTAMPLFVVGRVFAGLGVGLISVLIPMYQSECSPKWIRGAVVSAYQWAITIGLLLASVVNNATQARNNHSSYQIPIAVQFIWAIVLMFGMFFLPESPRWLIKKGRDADAAISLSRLTSLDVNNSEVELELDDIRANLKSEEEFGKTGYIDCFRGGPTQIGLRTLTGIFLQAWQQLTGINFIFYFGTQFFQGAGIGNAFLVSVATNIVNVFMTLPGMWGVERFGRRRLLIIGAIGMTVCEFIIAIVGVTVPTANKSGQNVLVAFVCIYIAFYAATWGPIPWVVTGEIFPLAVRAKAMSLSVASNWLWNFAIAYATPYLVNPGAGNANLGVKVFFIWGSTCFCCIVFSYFCIPETKGLSLEQVDIMYQHSSPIKSVQYRKQLIAADVHASDPTSIEKADEQSTDEKA